MLRPVFLRTSLTDILTVAPYAKYMKDIITNKRKIPEAEISTMLANYSFKGGMPKKLGDPGESTIPLQETTNLPSVDIFVVSFLSGQTAKSSFAVS